MRDNYIKKVTKGLVADISSILDRPVFTDAEAEVVSMLLEDKFNKLLEEGLSVHIRANQNLIDMIEFEEDGGNYMNLINGI